MNDAADASQRVARIWEWPLRLWHWLFALSLIGSLTTGLSGDIGWMDTHLLFGYTMVGLLTFRFVWGFAGGWYSRWRTYRTSPARMLAYFRGAQVPGSAASAAHTPPGVALVVVMLLAVLTQAVTGLFATDAIFIEGPLVRYASDDWVDTATAIHHRMFYLVILTIVAHLAAHTCYALRRDPLPLSMISGRRRVPAALPDSPAFGARAVALGLVTAGAVWTALDYL